MIVATLEGGLGNQMFQYAAGRALATRHDTELRLDASNYLFAPQRPYGLDQFGIRADVLSSSASLWLRARRRLASSLRLRGRLTFAAEPGSMLHPGFHDFPDHTCLCGYWQHEE